MTVGNLWWIACSNMGNAFVNHGAQNLLEDLINERVYPCNLQDEAWPDVIFISGAYGTSKIDVSDSTVIWNGVGMFKHDDDEADGWIGSASSVNCVITREDNTYRLLQERDIDAKRGVDPAWFLSDYIEPRPYYGEPYTLWSVRGESPPDKYDNAKEITHNFVGFSVDDICNSVVKDNIYDCVSIYANAERVVTDRVHGTIMALQYGTPVYLKRDHMNGVSEYGRAACVEVGCDLNDVTEDFVIVDRDKLEQRKNEHVRYLKTAINNAGLPLRGDGS